MRAAVLGAALAAAAIAAAPAAAQTAPAPFGHACVPQNGVRFCPTTDLASRPRSFDGTPIDVDVTLPARGDGPFPTVLLLHGLGGTKTSFESTTDGGRYTNRYFAERGYAVVTPTARGFGGSCGAATAASPGCEHGWTRLGDMRYEVRDIQTLAGQLVDEGIVDPKHIGATGISYGGGFSTMLAFLKNRIRTQDGGYAPWRSPHGTPISLAAAWPRWMWSNGESIFTRNGRGPWQRTPSGVVAQSYAGGIFAVAFSGNVAPTGGDLSTDITLWKQQLDSGRIGEATKPTLDNAYRYHGVAGLRRASGGPAPLLVQSGWTDALFPVGQALGAYEAIRKANPKAPVALQLADSGHGPGANHPKDIAAFESQGARFMAAWLGRPGGAKPKPGSVRAYTMTCPASKPAGGGPYLASSYARLARGALRLQTRTTLRITSKGASPTLAAKVPGLAAAGALCTRQAIDRTSRALLQRVSPGVTLLGQPRITGRVATTGRYGQIDARVWDRFKGRQRLITRGVYRLSDGQKGRFAFTLDGNGWRFAKGHRIVVELLGRDAPTYGASPTAFRAKLSRVRVALPVRDAPSRRKGIAKP
jgi:pimeloyl-ACP methyl ester carboxylesterase